MSPDEPRQNWALPGGSDDNTNSPNPEPQASQPAGQSAQWGPAGQWGGSGGGQWGAPASGQWGAPTGGPAFRPMQSHRPGIIPLRALRLTEILDGAFKALRHNPKVMFGVTLPVAAVAALLQALMMLRLFDTLEYDYLMGNFESDPTGVTGLFDDSVLWLGVAFAALNMLAIPLVTGVLTVSVSRSSLGKKLTIGETMQLIKGRKAALVGASFLSSLIALVPAGLMILALIVLFNAPSAILVLGIFGLGLLVLAATFYLITRLLLVPQVVVLERQPVFAAFKRGWLLTRGSFWRVLGIYLLATLIASVVSSIITTPMSILLGLVATMSLTLSSYIAGATTIVTLLITIPFSAAVASILYIDIRMRKEGLDIELARAAGESA